MRIALAAQRDKHLSVFLVEVESSMNVDMCDLEKHKKKKIKPC